jgi:hypothetical protein
MANEDAAAKEAAAKRAQEEAAAKAASARKADEAQAADSPYIWVISNRKDDRTVLFERDPEHPGGEAFVGGATPAKVGRTARIDQLLHSGEIIQIPEPPDGPKKPVDVAALAPQAPPAQPGQAIKLGRTLDPDLVPAGAMRRVEATQRQLPKEIPSRATVPPKPKPETETVSS